MALRMMAILALVAGARAECGECEDQWYCGQVDVQCFSEPCPPIEQCVRCPQLRCMSCAQGMVQDENGCNTCECLPLPSTEDPSDGRQCRVPGQVWNACGSPCQAQCSDEGDIPNIDCIEICQPRCECPRGKVLNPAGTGCITEQQCRALAPSTTAPVSGCRLDNGSLVASGTSWVDFSNPCATHFCDGRSVMTAMMGCPAPACANPVRVEGECCSRCERTEPTTEDPSTGRQCEVSDQVWNDCGSACPARCSDEGDIPIGNCIAMCQPGCECPRGKVLNPAGTGCITEQQCRALAPSTTAQASGCRLDNGSFVPSGTSWVGPGDACAINHCNGRSVMTAIVDCPAPPCANPVRVEGECCGRCDGPDVTEPAPMCEEECLPGFYCEAQTVQCIRQPCPPVYACQRDCRAVFCMRPVCEGGARPITLDGECCPVCPERTTDLSEPSTRPAPLCEEECESGYYCAAQNVQCFAEPCPPVYSCQMDCRLVDCMVPQCEGGVEPIRQDDSCCPVCPEREQCEEDCRDGWYCVDGECALDCRTVRCGMPVCEDGADPVRPDDACCHVCPGDLSTADPSGCSDVMCLMACEHGFDTDENGCSICSCQSPPEETDAPAECSEVMCDLWCEHGFENDENGCDICSCHSAPQETEAPAECSDVMCEMLCVHGFETDENGCDICSCLSPPEDTTAESATVEDTTVLQNTATSSLRCPSFSCFQPGSNCEVHRSAGRCPTCTCVPIDTTEVASTSSSIAIAVDEVSSGADDSSSTSTSIAIAVGAVVVVLGVIIAALVVAKRNGKTQVREQFINPLYSSPETEKMYEASPPSFNEEVEV